MQLLNQLGIANNTLIIFTSDNGAALVSRQQGKGAFKNYVDKTK